MVADYYGYDFGVVVFMLVVKCVAVLAMVFVMCFSFIVRVGFC